MKTQFLFVNQLSAINPLYFVKLYFCDLASLGLPGKQDVSYTHCLPSYIIMYGSLFVRTLKLFYQQGNLVNLHATLQIYVQIIANEESKLR